MRSQVALVTGADRGLGRALVEGLLSNGWTVLAGQHLDWDELDQLATRFPDTLRILPLNVSSDDSVLAAADLAAERVSHLDVLIANAGINRSAHLNSVREPLDYEDMQAEFSVNALGPLRVVRAFLPLLDRSDLKRLCFVSSEAGSIGASERTGWFGYCMSKAALNMAVKNLSNDLGGEGFTFRLYHPGWLRTYMRGTKNLKADMEPEEAASVALRYFTDFDDREVLRYRDWQGSDLPW